MDYQYEVYAVSSNVCDAWIAGVKDASVEYSYGGSRMVPAHFSDEQSEEALVRLMYEESHLKNKLINIALDSDLLADLEDQLPPNYLKSRVGGGRCIMRPKAKYFHIMQDTSHPEFKGVVSEIFKVIGAKLNELDGKVKLTPDFGRFGDLADELEKHTKHVLGVRCEIGGCGGKADYTTSGIIGGFKVCNIVDNGHHRSPFTLIGSAGALGSGVFNYLKNEEKCKDLSICDLAYDNGSNESPPSEYQIFVSEEGRFTDACLERGGNLIMTTYGEELENSNWNKIPQRTNLMLAHNLSMPLEEAGKKLARNLKDRNIFCLPGQLLTLGGALTSRLEWFWRQAYPRKDFTPKKSLAHKVSERVVGFLTNEVVKGAKKQDKTPYEVMWNYAESHS